ncbi:MAG: alpha/beta hydrolase family protein [Planctomycetes bacterium]|nr:alpha/beta hydrolase family protein [Planctomycetota bacterium]
MQIRLSCLVTVIGLATIAAPVVGQFRVTPGNAKGGKPFGEPWAGIPDSFRDFNVPEWPVPIDLEQWQQTERPRTRNTILKLLGELPPRPDPARVKVLSREDRGEFILERFEFFNGVDMTVPGILAIPKQLRRPAPAIIGMHGHSGSKEDYVPDPTKASSLGWMLAQRGYVVAAIDGYFNGERVGEGPRGETERGAAGQELSLFKLHLWQGRTLWGMMLRDEQCLIDYLQTRPEIDKGRIGATGGSMGCTRAWWTAAIDERIQAVVGVACFTRYTELLAHGSSHGIYYFVPGVLKHFDTEAIYALVAPRPMLQLSGDQDHGAPLDGVEVLEMKVGAVYRLHGQPDNFLSVVYKDTGHEYLPDMRRRMVEWFEKHLPVKR